MWIEHAAFVNALAEEGFLLVGGPPGVAAQHRAMLVVDAESDSDVRKRLLEDPWMKRPEVFVSPASNLGKS